MKKAVTGVAFMLFGVSPTASANTLKWNDSVTPSRVVLECEHDTSVPDSQTRNEIAQREGLVGRVNEIAQYISGMTTAGYRSAGGSGGNERFSYNVPVHLSYTRPLEFKTKVDSNGMRLGARRLDGQFRATVPPRAERYLSPRVKTQIDQLKQRWLNDVRNGTDALKNQLHEKPFPWNQAERDALHRQTHGTFVREQNVTFCRHNYRLHLRAEWRRQVDGVLGR